MKSLPCPRCGNKQVIDTFCADCERELHPLVKKFKEHTITLCVSSGDIKLQTAWERITLREAFEKTVKRTLILAKDATVTSKEFTIPEFEYIDKPGMDKTFELAVTVTGSRNGVEREEVYNVPINIKTTISKKYAKMGTQYYEGTLQLRNETEEHERALKKHFSRYPDLAINKTMDVPTGHDYHITDKQRMRQIAHKLHKHFGGVLKENARLITRDNQTSKDVYRLTIFIEFPPYKRGDVLTDEKQVLLVKGFGKKMHLQNIQTGKKVELAYKRDALSKVETFVTKISQTHPETAILDPETYQQVPVRSREELVIDQEVTVIQHQGSWWVV